MSLSKLVQKLPSQRGVGLIEIMVGLTAGLVLIGALAYFFLGSRQVNRTHQDVSRMQESGRFAVEILGRAIRQAGARANVSVPFVDALVAADGSSGGPDRITVSYDVQDGGAANGAEVDCVGDTIAAGARITQTFTVDTSIPALTCTTPARVAAGLPPVVVVDNIENMQLTYGVDSTTPTKDGRIDSYQTAESLTPGQVAAVGMSLLVRGPTANSATSRPSEFSYGGDDVPTDGYLRRVFFATFTVRNQAQ